jgi:transposase
LVNPETRGDPTSLLRWTSKSTYNLAEELVRQGYKVSDHSVGRLLKRLGYSLWAPSKQKEGAKHGGTSTGTPSSHSSPLAPSV